MYCPFLRGRQFELLALRELLENDLIGDNILPIIEPVKLSSSLLKTVELFNEKNHKLVFVQNPSVGAYPVSMDGEKADKNPLYGKLKIELDKGNVIKAYLFQENNEIVVNDMKNSIAIIDSVDDISNYLEAYKNENPVYTIIPDRRSIKRSVKGEKIILEDSFIKQKRNVDYQNNIDEFFSDWHREYGKEDYKGFSDYSIVGSEYSESGFAPKAVAIHIVYLSSEDDLRVHHFVSENNIDNKDTPGKFGEAVAKIKPWCTEHKVQETRGLKAFYDYCDTGRYPGLGVVKKCSIMHHLELMSKHLGETK